MHPEQSDPLDLQKVKVIDQHCHLMPNAANQFTREFFIRAMSLESYNPDYLISQPLMDRYLKSSLNERSSLDQTYGVREVLEASERSGETTLLFKESIKQLAKFLRVPYDFSKVLEARNRRAASNYSNYAGIYTLVVSDHPYLPYTEPAAFRPAILKHKLVLPALIFNALDEASSFSEATSKFLPTLEECLGQKGFVGIKSMIAYGGSRRGSGLAIGNVDESTAAKEFSLYKERKGSVIGQQIKGLLDYFHCLALKEAIRFRRPFEFHTGIGDTDVLADACNPMLLVGLLQDEEIRKAKIILLHGGYPYVAEAGWMTHFFPNVYLDSSIVYFTHFLGATRRMEEMLEMAPYSKLLYSSDGMVPELQWFCARFAKRVMSAVLERLIKAGTLDDSEARDLADSYFHANAKKLYSLPD